jgi:hypothetical protein
MPAPVSLWSDVADFIGRVGFPVFVAVWLLVRSDKILRALTDAVTKLTAVLESRKDV